MTEHSASAVEAFDEHGPERGTLTRRAHTATRRLRRLPVIEAVGRSWRSTADELGGPFAGFIAAEWVAAGLLGALFAISMVQAPAIEGWTAMSSRKPDRPGLHVPSLTVDEPRQNGAQPFDQYAIVPVDRHLITAMAGENGSVGGAAFVRSDAAVAASAPTTLPPGESPATPQVPVPPGATTAPTTAAPPTPATTLVPPVTTTPASGPTPPAASPPPTSPNATSPATTAPPTPATTAPPSATTPAQPAPATTAPSPPPTTSPAVAQPTIPAATLPLVGAVVVPVVTLVNDLLGGAGN